MPKRRKKRDPRRKQQVRPPNDHRGYHVPNTHDPDKRNLIRDLLSLGDTLAPIEFYRDTRGKLVLVKGHRRVAALRLLLGDKAEVEAIEVAPLAIGGR